jgi:hypothetical protein
MSPEQIQKIRSNAEAGNRDAQFLLSQIHRQQNDFDGMLHWLNEASANNLPDAMSALGQCYEKGFGLPRDFPTALVHYESAINAGSPIAALHKAELLYKSQQSFEHHDLVLNLLISAAQAGVVPALRVVGYLALQQASSAQLGRDCLRHAARADDPVSSFNLAWCLLRGVGGDKNQSAAAWWLQKAAGANYPLTEKLQAELQGVQAHPDEQDSHGNIDFTVPFSLFPSAFAGDTQVIHDDPAIKQIDSVLDEIDCAYLIHLARPHMRRADVIDPESRQDGMVSDVRTSMSTYLPFGLVDIIGRYIESRIVLATGEDLDHSEPMSILHYSPGEYYRPHFDFFDPQLNVSKELLEDGGQRIASAVSYLVAPTKGGGTRFPKLDLTVPAAAGSTLWFRNCHPDGEVDKRSLHAGDPVEQGEKWVVTKWFRERPTRYLEF